MNAEDQRDAEERIHFYVWAGFYKPSEILEFICEDQFEPEVIDKTWALDQITQETDLKRREEQNWPASTDCDKLTKAFADLKSANIIALQNAGFDQSEGLEDVSEIWNEKGNIQSPIKGYCFFHEQDLESAVSGDGLMLTFGDIQGDDAKGVLIGKTIVEILQSHGFRAQWEGTISKRIELPDIKWQKKS